MRTWLNSKNEKMKDLYNLNPNKCKRCQSIIPFHSRKNIFCSKICSGYFATKGKHQSKETKIKISNGVKQSVKYQEHVKSKTLETISFCCVCYSVMENVIRITCSDECRHILRIKRGQISGKISASKRVLRSKHEIELYNLLNSKYECIHNQAMFNGWDADIIIPSLKLAILWNGIWHYEKVHKNHHLLQVQNRDLLKIKEINNFGYTYIIVKDHNNQMTPDIAFTKINECITNKSFNIEIN